MTKKELCNYFRGRLESLEVNKELFDSDYDLFTQGDQKGSFGQTFGYGDVDILKYQLPSVKKEVSSLIVATVLFGEGDDVPSETMQWLEKILKYDYKRKGWTVEGDLDLRQSPDYCISNLPDNLLVQGSLKLNVDLEKLPEYLMVRGDLWKNGNKLKNPDTMVVRGGIIEDDFMGT